VRRQESRARRSRGTEHGGCGAEQACGAGGRRRRPGRRTSSKMVLSRPRPRVAVSSAFLRPSRPRVAILKVTRVVPCRGKEWRGGTERGHELLRAKKSWQPAPLGGPPGQAQGADGGSGARARRARAATHLERGLHVDHLALALCKELHDGADVGLGHLGVEVSRAEGAGAVSGLPHVLGRRARATRAAQPQSRPSTPTPTPPRRPSPPPPRSPPRRAPS
jgi:hypothetical protein